jgi:hypothetical protein
MISLYVNALLCTLQHIVIHAMQLSGVNSENMRAGFLCATLYTIFRTHPAVLVFAAYSLQLNSSYFIAPAVLLCTSLCGNQENFFIISTH